LDADPRLFGELCADGTGDFIPTHARAGTDRSNRGVRAAFHLLFISSNASQQQHLRHPPDGALDRVVEWDP
jgi:hypothetical protein